jgi:hypothetical protein
MKIPSVVLPLLVISAILGSFLLRTAFTLPTTNVSYSATGDETVSCIVDGVKCKGTANFFTNLYTDTPGIAGIETFATEHRVIFRYDPKQISPDRIKEIMEAPIPLRDGTTRQVFVCESME